MWRQRPFLFAANTPLHLEPGGPHQAGQGYQPSGPFGRSEFAILSRCRVDLDQRQYPIRLPAAASRHASLLSGEQLLRTLACTLTVGLLFVGACSDRSAEPATCLEPDYDCLFDNLDIIEPRLGTESPPLSMEPISWWIYAQSLENDGEGAERPTLRPSGDTNDLTFRDLLAFEDVELAWTNALGGRPALCFYLCQANTSELVPYHCSADVHCLAANPDEGSEGRANLALRWRAHYLPANAIIQPLALVVAPVVTSGPLDPLKELKYRSSNVLIGSSAVISLRIEQPPLSLHNDAGPLCGALRCAADELCISSRRCWTQPDATCQCEEGARETCDGLPACQPVGADCQVAPCCAGASCVDGVCEIGAGRCP